MIPKELKELLKIAEESLKTNKDGELILPIRKKIWKSFGESKDINNLKAKITLGQKRRVELARLSVYKVLDIWNNNMKNDDRPEKLLEMAKEYIEGKCDVESIDKAGQEFVTYLEEILSEKIDTIVEVGYAAFDTIIKAKHDEILLVSGTHDDLDDELDEWDASYDSACAYAGGAKWQEKSSSEKRREFWMWYIKESVPKAYLSYED